MKLNIPIQFHSNNISTSGNITVSNPLILAQDPVIPLEAATKQYIDSSFSSLNANNVTSGNLFINKLFFFY